MFRSRPAAADRRSLPRRQPPAEPGPMAMTYLEIREVQEGDWLRLRVTGELDMASTPRLRHRLEQLRAERQAVRLDFSGLEFMDSSGLHLVASVFDHARDDGWQLEVDRELPHQVERVLKLTQLDRILDRHPTNASSAVDSQPQTTGPEGNAMRGSFVAARPG